MLDILYYMYTYRDIMSLLYTLFIKSNFVEISKTPQIRQCQFSSFSINQSIENYLFCTLFLFKVATAKNL